MPKTVLDFPEVTDAQLTDIIYVIRGTGAARDKKIQLGNLLAAANWVSIYPVVGNTLDLSTLEGNTFVHVTGGAGTLTLSNDFKLNSWAVFRGSGGAGVSTIAGTFAAALNPVEYLYVFRDDQGNYQKYKVMAIDPSTNETEMAGGAIRNSSQIDADRNSTATGATSIPFEYQVRATNPAGLLDTFAAYYFDLAGRNGAIALVRKIGANETNMVFYTSTPGPAGLKESFRILEDLQLAAVTLQGTGMRILYADASGILKAIPTALTQDRVPMADTTSGLVDSPYGVEAVTGDSIDLEDNHKSGSNQFRSTSSGSFGGNGSWIEYLWNGSAFQEVFRAFFSGGLWLWQITAHLRPGADATFDIGSLASRFKDLFLSGNAEISGKANVADTITAQKSIASTWGGEIASLPPTTAINWTAGNWMALNMQAAAGDITVVLGQGDSEDGGTYGLIVYPHAGKEITAWSGAAAGTVEWAGGVPPDVSAATNKFLVTFLRRGNNWIGIESAEIS